MNIDEYYKIMTKQQNLSKNDILTKINNIKLIKTKNSKVQSNKRSKNLNAKYVNLGRKNLTYTNLSDYCYDYKNITERKIKNPLVKIKKEIMLDLSHSYSSFISRNSNTNFFNSELIITGLDSTKKARTKINYGKYMLEKKMKNKFNNINAYSDYKTRSNTSRHMKSNNFNDNTRFLKTYNLFFPKENKKYLKEFNYDVLSNDYSRENMDAFMEKTRIIRREKFKNFIIDNIIFSRHSMNEGDFQLVKIQKDEYFKNLMLLSKFDKSFSRYLGYLETQNNKESQKLNQLKKRKHNLQIIINRLQKQISNINFEISKYKNIKKFLISAKYDSEELINKDKNNYDLSFFITEANNINDKSNKKLSLYKYKNPKSGNIEQNSSVNKAKLLTQHSINLKDNLNLNLDLFSLNQKNRRSSKKDKTLRKLNSTSINGKKTPRLENDYEFNLFTNFENSILNSINVFNQKRKSITELKNILIQTKNNYEEEFINNNLTISTKEMKLYFLKIRNKDLQTRYQSIIRNTLLKESFKIKLEKKIYNILVDFNKEINLEKQLGIKNLFQFLKMKSDDFFEKKNVGKLIYMIKIIELVDSFLDDFKSKYLSDQKLKKQYENALIIVEKEKNLEKIRLNRELLKKNLEERKKKIIKKSTQVRFFSYKKYNIKSHQHYKNHFIKKVKNKKNKLLPSYEEWLTYG